MKMILLLFYVDILINELNLVLLADRLLTSHPSLDGLQGGQKRLGVRLPIDIQAEAGVEKMRLVGHTPGLRLEDLAGTKDGPDILLDGPCRLAKVSKAIPEIHAETKD